MKNKIKIITVFILIVTLFSGCSAGDLFSFMKSDGEKKLPDFPVTYDGITFEKEPERIVSLSASVTEVLYDIGLSSKLVGKGDDCNYPDSSSSIPKVGTYLDPKINDIIALAPDVVITSAPLSKSDASKLDGLSIPVVIIEKPKNISDVFKTTYQLFVLLKGDFTGKTEGAEYLKTFYQEMDTTFMKIRSYMADGKSPVSALLLVDYDGHAATGDTFENYFLEQMMLSNIAFEYEKWEIPAEKLAESNPDIIICPENITVEALSEYENYKDLSAVKDNNIYRIDLSCFSACSKRMLTELSKLAKAIYPTAFSSSQGGALTPSTMPGEADSSSKNESSSESDSSENSDSAE